MSDNTNPTTPEKQPGLIYEKMASIIKRIGPVGKDGHNVKQNYDYRSIYAIYAELHPLFGEFGVFMTFNILKVECSERNTASGGSISCVKADIEYSFIASDGSHINMKTVGFGESMTDKALTVALSNAQKSVLSQTFLVPVGDDADQDEKKPTSQPTSSFKSGNTYTKQTNKAKADPIPENKPQETEKKTLEPEKPAKTTEKVDLTNAQRITAALIAKGWMPEDIKTKVAAEIDFTHGLVDEETALLILAKKEGLEMPTAEDLHLKDPPKTYQIKKVFEKKKKDGNPYYSGILQELDANSKPIGDEFNMSIWDVKDEFKKVPFTPVKIQAIITPVQNGQYTNYNYDKDPGIVIVA
jgi:hypothetical protein